VKERNVLLKETHTRKLRVSDEEGRDPALVQQLDVLVNVRVHDGLTDEREGAVFDVEGLLESLLLDARDTLHLLDGVAMVLNGLLDEELRVIDLPAARPGTCERQ